MSKPQLLDALQASLPQYTFERELSGGGMSRVFLATETALGRQIVVKVLPPEMAGQLSLDRFKREVALAATLQHPHIVPLLTAGEVNGVPYFTMPYVRGESLRALLSTHGELPVGTALRLLRQIASALAYAHAEGVVHRDIKPENILLSGDAGMVTDFGVARAVTASAASATALTSVGVAVGTPAYMSPEQASADPSIDQRADIYAWGVVAYELLTGAAPFAGRSAAAMLAAHVSEPPEPIDKRRPQIPPSIAALVMRCLEKRPADRPQQARDLTQVLDEMTTPTGTSGPGLVPSRGRRPAIIIGAGVAVALMIVVASIVRLRGSGTTAPAGSVAVLPLDVANTDTTVAYVAEGITDGLSTDLVRRGVRVAPRASTYAIHAKESDPRKIASALGVSAVFEGRLRTLGPKLRVTYELIGADGTLLTQDTFEQEGATALAMQGRILNAVSEQLGIRTSTGSRREHTVDEATYDLYLRASHAISGYSKPGLDRAIVLLQQVTARDSTYAPAWNQLALAYMALADGYDAPTAVLPQARAAINRALAVDSSSSAAHATLGSMCIQYFRDFDCADRELARALSLDSNNADAYLWRYAMQLMSGDSRAGANLTRAIHLDPLNVILRMSKVEWYTVIGQPDSAIAEYHAARDLDPGFFYMEPGVGDAFRMKGWADSAVAVDSVAWADHKQPVADLVISLVAAGRIREARARLAEVERYATQQGSYLPPELIARAALSVGDSAKAVRYLERGLDRQSSVANLVPSYKDLRGLRGYPPFDAYLKRAGMERFIPNQKH